MLQLTRTKIKVFNLHKSVKKKGIETMTLNHKVC